MKRPLAFAGLALVGLFAAEVTCRVEEWIRFRTPPFTRATSLNDLLARDRDGAHGRRGVVFQKWHMNGLGLRGPEVDSAKAPGTVRIVTAGASEAFGLYESPDREFPRQLEDSLQARVTAGRCAPGVERFEVLNAAFRGMSLPTVAQDLRLRMRRFTPDVVIYYPTPAQYLEAEVPVAAARDSSVGAPAVLAPWRAAMPRFAGRLREQARSAVPRAAREWRQRRLLAAAARRRPGWRFTAVPPDRLAAFAADLAALVGTTRAIGAVPLLATHANAFASRSPEDWNPHYLSAWERFYPRASGPVIVAFDAAARQAIQAVARDSAATAVDVAEAIQAPELFADFSHFTDAGAGAAARVLADGVLQALERAGLPACN